MTYKARMQEVYSHLDLSKSKLTHLKQQAWKPIIQVGEDTFIKVQSSTGDSEPTQKVTELSLKFLI